MGDRVRGRSMEGRNRRPGQRQFVMCDLSNGCHYLWTLALVSEVSDHCLLIVPSLVFLLLL